MTGPVVLALETATEWCSVAIRIGTQTRALAERNPQGHSELILPMVQRLLAEAELPLHRCSVVAVGRGPGSFTALRIGVGVAQGLAYGAGLPVAPVSSLQALALQFEAPRVLTVLDARMHEVYWAAYVRDAEGIPRPCGEVRVSAPAELRCPETAAWLVVGNGAEAYREVLEHALAPAAPHFVSGAYPRAAEVARLGALDFLAGKVMPPALAAPEYVRMRVTHAHQGPGVGH